MIGSALYGAVVLAASLTTAAPALNEENFAHWRDFIRPTAAESRWQEIQWRPIFWKAVVEAQKADKPILLWAMNGHPLACV
jgi:hypothetical protein